jgi:hypothetical protein
VKVNDRLYQMVYPPTWISSKEDNKLYMKIEDAKINYLVSIASHNYMINETEERLDALKGTAYSSFLKKRIDTNGQIYTITGAFEKTNNSFVVGLTDEGGTNAVKYSNQYYIPVDDLLTSLKYDHKIEVNDYNKLITLEFSQKN